MTPTPKPPRRTRNIYIKPEHKQYWEAVQKIGARHGISLSDQVALTLRDFVADHDAICNYCSMIEETDKAP